MSEERIKEHKISEKQFLKYVAIFSAVVFVLILIISFVRKNVKLMNANNSAVASEFYEETIFDDIKIKLNNDIFSHEQVINEVKEADLIDYLKKNLIKGDTIIYVSMDIGVQQLLMAKLVEQSGKVYVFNPIEKYADAIAISAKANGFDTRIVASSHAISDVSYDGLLVHKNGALAADGSLQNVGYNLQNGYSAMPVSVETIDRLCSNLQNVNVLRISFAENLSKILRGAEQLISRSPNIQIIADYNSEKTKDLSELENLRKLGFTVYFLTNKNLEKITDLTSIPVQAEILVIKK